MSKLVAVILLAFLLACGGSGGKGAGTDAAASDGGSAGTATPGPTATPAATPTPTPTTTTPNATPTTSTPTTTTTNSTSPPDPCAGLMPATPLAAAIEHVEPFSSFPWYATGTSDGDGDFVATLDGYKFNDYAFYDAQTPGGFVGTLQVGSNLDAPGPALAPQPHGYHSLPISTFGMPTPHLIVSDGKGHLVADVLFSNGAAASSIAPDPGGGSAVLTEAFPTGTGSWLERFDENGKSRGVAALDPDHPAPGAAVYAGPDVAVAAGGEALVASSGAQARWYDRDAKPVSDAFASGLAAAKVVKLAPLADGSLAARDQDGVWVARYGPPAAVVDPAPAWLVERGAGREVWVVRGGQAMVLAPIATLAQSPRCTGGCGKFELVTADGHSCGTFELPGGSDEPVNVGKDGTVFALTYDGFTSVHWRWWSKLLK